VISSRHEPATPTHVHQKVMICGAPATEIIDGAKPFRRFDSGLGHHVRKPDHELSQR
jgi:hypothetical protein